MLWDGWHDGSDCSRDVSEAATVQVLQHVLNCRVGDRVCRSQHAIVGPEIGRRVALVHEQKAELLLEAFGRKL